jgi:hypothetical protein
VRGESECVRVKGSWHLLLHLLLELSVLVRGEGEVGEEIGEARELRRVAGAPHLLDL